METFHDRGSRELAKFIIDLEDEDCPKFHLHLAAYQGDIPQIRTLLEQNEFKKVSVLLHLLIGECKLLVLYMLIYILSCYSLHYQKDKDGRTQ